MGLQSVAVQECKGVQGGFAAVCGFGCRVCFLRSSPKPSLRLAFFRLVLSWEWCVWLCLRNLWDFNRSSRPSWAELSQGPVHTDQEPGLAGYMLREIWVRAEMRPQLDPVLGSVRASGLCTTLPRLAARSNISSGRTQSHQTGTRSYVGRIPDVRGGARKVRSLELPLQHAGVYQNPTP